MTLCVGCSPLIYDQMTYSADDMYATHDQKAIAAKEVQEAQAAEQLKELRKAQWATTLGYTTTIIDTKEYQTPYGEKLLALSADTYQRPTSYYSLEYQEATLERLANYDPAIYNATVSNSGEITIEPKYRSSIYGAWDDPYYAASWAYGYPSPYSWSIGLGYSPYYSNYWGYSPYYSPYYYPYWGYRPLPPPYYSTTSYRKPTLVRKADPYRAPSSAISSGGTRQVSGATVGSSSGSTYSRGGSSSSSATRVPSIQSPSTPSAPQRQVNSIGR